MAYGSEQSGSPWRGAFKYDNKPVITQAPDAYLFINGQDMVPVCMSCGDKADIHDTVTSIGTSLGINTPGSGSANIALKTPRHSKTALIKDGEPVIHTMDEIEIWMKGFFLVDGMPRYYPVFWGLVTSVGWRYADGFHNMDLGCNDILHWWSITNVNYNPSALAQSFDPNHRPTGFTNIFKRSNPFEILLLLAQTTMLEAVVPDQFVNTLNTESAKEIFSAGSKQLIEYWRQRFSQLARSIKIFGMDGTTVASNLEFDMAADKFTFDNADISKAYTPVNVLGIHFKNRETTAASIASKEEQEASNQINADLKKKRAALRRARGAAKETLEKEIKRLEERLAGLADRTEERITNMVDFLPDVTVGINGLVNSEYRSKLDVANSLKDMIGWEFFMDTTGEIIFKPPFYNLDVRVNPVNVIKDEHIIDFDFTENEPEFTQIIVAGSLNSLHQGDSVRPSAWFTDYRLASQFGLRVTNADVNWARKPMECLFYAMNEVSIADAMRKQMSVTIPLRPEMRLGVPVYIEPFDQFWYIENISHNYAPGSTATTTLSLIAGRGRYHNHDEGLATFMDPRNRAILNGTTYGKAGERFIDTGIANVAYVQKALALATFDEIVKSAEHISPEDAKRLVESNVRNEENLGKVKAFPNLAPQGAKVEFLKNGGEPSDLSILASARSPDKIIEDMVAGKRIGNAFGAWVPRVMPEDTSFLSLDEYASVIPASDMSGYELIGLFPYGRNVQFGITGGLTVTATEGRRRTTQEDRISVLLNMTPDEYDEAVAPAQQGRGPNEAGVFRVDAVDQGRVLLELLPEDKSDTLCKCRMIDKEFDLSEVFRVVNIDFQGRPQLSPEDEALLRKYGFVGMQFATEQARRATRDRLSFEEDLRSGGRSIVRGRTNVPTTAVTSFDDIETGLQDQGGDE